MHRKDKATARLAPVELEALAAHSMRAPTVAGLARGSDAAPIPTRDLGDDLVIPLAGAAPDPRTVLEALAPRPAVLVEDLPDGGADLAADEHEHERVSAHVHAHGPAGAHATADAHPDPSDAHDPVARPAPRPSLPLAFEGPVAKRSDLGITLASVLVLLAIAAAIFAYVRYGS